VEGKIRNPKSEIRNKSEGREMGETMKDVAIRFLVFKIFRSIVSDFDIRISDFRPQRWMSSIS